MKITYNFENKGEPLIATQAEYPGEKLNLWVESDDEAERLYNSELRHVLQVFVGRGESERLFSPSDFSQNISRPFPKFQASGTFEHHQPQSGILPNP
jgi:hypothetical protein